MTKPDKPQCRVVEGDLGRRNMRGTTTEREVWVKLAKLRESDVKLLLLLLIN